MALEPSPTNLRALSENLQLNQVDGRVKLFPCAAGREQGTLPFYVMPRGNHSSFIKRDDDNFTPSYVIDVQVSPIDEVMKAEKVKVDYFRMDVEGYESEVIEGMAETLADVCAPSGAFIEVHPVLLRQNGSSTVSFVKRLEEFGYTIKTARYMGRRRPVVHSNAELLAHPLVDAPGCWEAFFVRAETLE